jgi:hypothetical protein
MHAKWIFECSFVATHPSPILTAPCLWRTPEPICLLSASSFVYDLQLASANVVDEPVKSQASLTDRSSNSRMLLEHFDRLLHIQFRNASSARIIVDQLLQLGLVLPPQSVGNPN